MKSFTQRLKSYPEITEDVISKELYRDIYYEFRRNVRIEVRNSRVKGITVLPNVYLNMHDTDFNCPTLSQFNAITHAPRPKFIL